MDKNERKSTLKSLEPPKYKTIGAIDNEDDSIYRLSNS
jgi:hypothetical protein